MIRVHDLKIDPRACSPQKRRDYLLKRIAHALDIEADGIRGLHILHEAVDARDKREIRLIYTADLLLQDPQEEDEIFGAAHLRPGNGPGGEVFFYRGLKLSRVGSKEREHARYRLPQPAGPGGRKLQHRPVVVGFGPAGMFAALILAEAGYAPLVLERGKAMDQRLQDVEAFWQGGPLNPESNVQFGEGGAGTFSDGKLTTGTHDERISKVLDVLAQAAHRPELRYQKKPHIGTDQLRSVVVDIRKQIEELGGQVCFETKVIGYRFVPDQNGCLQLTALLTERAGASEELPCQAAIFALGHSARDTWRTFYGAGLTMEQKPFSMGVRAEHRQEAIDRSQYGQPAHKLGLEPADYKLAVRVGEEQRGVYTFCMCPGGTVVAASSEEGLLCTNGMSNSARDGENANSAILVDVRTSDYESEDPLAGIAFQEKYERLAFELGGGTYKAPAQRLGDFLAAGRPGKSNAAAGRSSQKQTEPVEPTYQRGVLWAPIDHCLPAFVADSIRQAMPLFGRKIKGFDDPETVLTAIESRSSSPVRIPRNAEGVASQKKAPAAKANEKAAVQTEEPAAPLEGFYPAGEGAGYAGGIVSAAVDGIRQAEALLQVYRPYSSQSIPQEGK